MATSALRPLLLRSPSSCQTAFVISLISIRIDMTSDSSIQHPGPGFDRSDFLRLTVLVLLILIYPMLGMFWHHDYPIFTSESALLLFAFLLGAAVLSLLLQYCRPLVRNLTLFRAKSHLA